MPTINELRAELDDVTTLKLISSAFTEASAARVQKIKKDFENNQQFFVEISRLYHLVQMSAKKQKDGENGKNGHGNKPDAGTLSVAVTSNQRFYGNININIMTEYTAKTKKEETDLLVIGSTGRDFMKSVRDERHWDQLSFVKENPTAEEVASFLDKTAKYGKIIVYFPKFISLVRQDVGVTDITQTTETGSKIEDDEINMIFEPDLSMILDFFKRQVRALLFLRVMLESDLARTAARLITMSGAEERSNDMMKIKKRELRKLQTSITNAKLLETFAAMSGWKK
jgi:ATP synthase F1 gamma subunit